MSEKKINFGLNFVNLDIDLDLDIRVQNNLELEIEKKSIFLQH